VNSFDDAKRALKRIKAFGAFSVKSYNQPRREQRQQILKAARKLNMHVYPEGGSTLQHNLNMVADGHKFPGFSLILNCKKPGNFWPHAFIPPALYYMGQSQASQQK
jgi:hypothetical protein